MHLAKDLDVHLDTSIEDSAKRASQRCLYPGATTSENAELRAVQGY